MAEKTTEELITTLTWYDGVDKLKEILKRLQEGQNNLDASISVKDDGTIVNSSVKILNFIGSGVSISDSGEGEIEIDIDNSAIGDLEQAIINGPIATSVPTFEGGVVIGDSTIGLITFPTTLQSFILASSGELLLFSDQINLGGTNAVVTNNGQVLTIAPTTYDASTNTPTLSNSNTGVNGVLYPVAVGGAQDYGDGNVTLLEGDYVGNIGGKWIRVIDNNQSGIEGDSAYDVAVENGFVGTEAEWLASLVGPAGETGPNGTLAAWNGEFSKDFTFDNTTGLLNQTTTGNIVFVSNYNDTFINGGANYRIENFQCHADASDAINIIYGDFNASSTTTIASSAIANLPAIPVGRSRLVLGVCIKTGDNDYKLYSRYFRLPKERSDYYPFDRDVTQRDGNLKVVTDIQDIKITINSPNDAYDQYGKLKKIRPTFMTNNGLYRWQIEDSKGVSLGFLTTFTNSLQSGVVTLDCPERIGAGMTVQITQDFDIMPDGVQYSFNENWYLDDDILLKAIQDWNTIKASDFVTSNNGLIYLDHSQDISVALFGNSMQTHNITADDNDNPENLPPSCQTKYVSYQMFEDAVFNKPQYDRFDSAVNTFTESGTFTDGDNFSANSFKRGAELMRYSSTSSAYVEWDWNLANYTNLNFIFATDDANANNLTVTVSTGTGDIEVWNGSAWVEADSYSFDQIAESFNTANGDLGWTINDRLRFRRVATSGTPTIRIAKGANDDVLYYWGTERYNGNTVWFGNEGYSANNIGQLEDKYNSSLFAPNKHYNVILFELPLINDSGSDLTALSNSYEDFIWGDRVGFENANSLKNLTSDWTTSKMVFILPPIAHNSYNTDGTLNSTGVSAIAKWNTIKNLINTKGDVPYIDMNAGFTQESRLRGINMYNITLGNSINYNNYYTLTGDDIHYNNYGVRLLAKFLAPIFW